MPFAIGPADRKLLLIAGSVLLVLGAALAIIAPPAAEQGGGLPSIYSSTSGGARAAYLMLKELDYHVEAWEQSPAELPEDSEHDVLIIANPVSAPEEAERAALLRFVKSGGRILFTGPLIGVFFKDANISEEALPREWKSYSANFPSNFTAGAPKITLQPQAEWGAPSSAQLALYGDQFSPVVVRWRIGAGEIVWWAGPTPLTNAGISQEGNLNLLLDAVSDPAAASSEQPEIYWDEYFHGERASLWGFMQKTPLPWGLLQLALIGFAVLFTFSRRSGPIAMPAVVSRLAPLEFVDTLGGLYERAHAEPAVINVVYQRLRSMLTRQLRLPGATSDAELERAVETRLGFKDGAFSDALRRAAEASRSRKVAPAEALGIIRDLEDLEEQLGLKRKKS
ncbi:MAG: DUF4350 domain-containing protein [Candidatus Acidiferrales bacterium]